MAANWIEQSGPEHDGRIVSQSELAEIFGTTRETINEWQGQGMPFQPRAGIGGANAYATGACSRWRAAHEARAAAGGETPKDRLARVQAERIELELAERRGQLVPVEAIEPAWERVVAAVRTSVLTLPDLAPLLELTPGAEQKREVIEERVTVILKDLSDGRGVDLGPQAGAAAVRPAGKDVGSPVG